MHSFSYSRASEPTPRADELGRAAPPSRVDEQSRAGHRAGQPDPEPHHGAGHEAAFYVAEPLADPDRADQEEKDAAGDATCLLHVLQYARRLRILPDRPDETDQKERTRSASIVRRTRSGGPMKCWFSASWETPRASAQPFQTWIGIFASAHFSSRAASGAMPTPTTLAATPSRRSSVASPARMM